MHDLLIKDYKLVSLKASFMVNQEDLIRFMRIISLILKWFVNSIIIKKCS